METNEMKHALKQITTEVQAMMAYQKNFIHIFWEIA